MANNKISLKDIYEIVNRLEDKMDRRLLILENRVDILEEFKGKVLGIAGFIGALAGSVISVIWNSITGKK
jgi:hypothetical protein